MGYFHYQWPLQKPEQVVSGRFPTQNHAYHLHLPKIKCCLSAYRYAAGGVALQPAPNARRLPNKQVIYGIEKKMTSNHVAVTPETHKNVKIRVDTGFGFAKNKHIVPVVINEFADVAANCPIVFVKDENGGQLRVAAMMGLSPEINLYVQDNEWQGTHVPMNLGRLPFAFAPVGDGNMLGAALDMDSEQVSETEGKALFEESGEPTEYFKQVNVFLSTLFQGEVATQKFTDAIEKYDLLREFHVQMEDENGGKRELVGLFTPTSNRLKQLSDEAVVELNKEGILAGLHIAIQSMAQIKRLARLHNQLDGTKIKSVRLEMIDDAEPVVQ